MKKLLKMESIARETGVEEVEVPVMQKDRWECGLVIDGLGGRMNEEKEELLLFVHHIAAIFSFVDQLTNVRNMRTLLHCSCIDGNKQKVLVEVIFKLEKTVFQFTRILHNTLNVYVVLF